MQCVGSWTLSLARWSRASVGRQTADSVALESHATTTGIEANETRHAVSRIRAGGAHYTVSWEWAVADSFVSGTGQVATLRPSRAANGTAWHRIAGRRVGYIANFKSASGIAGTTCGRGRRRTIGIMAAELLALRPAGIDRATDHTRSAIVGLISGSR
jgi:hypothetical protein